MDDDDIPSDTTAVTVTDERPYDPPPIGPRRLTRSTSDRMVAGVCGGMAAYLGVDATLVRVGFMLLSIAGGLGVIAYALAWVLLPEEGETTPRFRSPWQIAALVVGVLLLSNLADLWDGDGAVLPLALLTVGAVLVWGGRDDGSRRGTDGTTAPSPGQPVAAAQAGGGRWASAPPPPPPSPPPLPPPPSSRSTLGRSLAVGLGGMLIAIGAISGAVAWSADVAPTLLLGLVLAGFGAAMVVGSWWGWSRPLAFGGMGVVLAIATVAIIDVPISGGVGERLLRPGTLAEVPRVERLAIGELTLDLTALELTGDERRVEASVAIGELVVEVPAGVTVEVHAEAGAGQLDVLGTTDDGASVRLNQVFEGSGPGRVELDLQVGIGHVEVRRDG